jgi:hypothetical protein
MSKASNEHSLRKVVSGWLAQEMRNNRLWYMKLSGSRFQRVGAPDYIVVVNGRFIAIELKNPGEEPSPAQQREGVRIKAAGKAPYWVLTSLQGVKDAVGYS